MRNCLPLLRAERGWSQQKLAEELGVSRQTVNAIEKERYDPSLPLAFEIAWLFGCAIEDVFRSDRHVEAAPIDPDFVKEAVVEAKRISPAD